jgi:hypothetical protein
MVARVVLYISVLSLFLSVADACLAISSCESPRSCFGQSPSSTFRLRDPILLQDRDGSRPRATQSGSDVSTDEAGPQAQILTGVQAATARRIPVERKCKPSWNEAVGKKMRLRSTNRPKMLTIRPGETFPVQHLEVQALVTVLCIYEMRKLDDVELFRHDTVVVDAAGQVSDRPGAKRGNVQCSRHHVDPSVSQSLAVLLESVTLQPNPCHDLMRRPAVGVVCAMSAQVKQSERLTHPTVGSDGRLRFGLGIPLFRIPNHLQLQTCADSRGCQRVSQIHEPHRQTYTIRCACPSLAHPAQSAQREVTVSYLACFFFLVS